MIDLFGLGKNQEPQEPAKDAPAPEAASAAPAEGAAAESAVPRGSHKLWAFLLVLDSVFVIVFAGAVAAKVYQHWKAPAVVLNPPRPRKAKPVDAPAPSTAAAAAPEPAKAPEPPKPEPPKAPEPKPAAEAPRPPKPSMLAEAPKHRETPKLADAGGKPAAAPAKPAAPPPADGKVKALKTEFKLHAPKAKNVELVGAFIVRGGRKEMARQDDGTWTVTLYLNPGSYRYFFSVDKKKQLDPENPHSEKGASLLSLP